MQAAVKIDEFQQFSFPDELVVTELHSSNTAHVTQALELNAERLVLRRSPAETAVGRHVWLELSPDGEPMRILARVAGRTLAETTFAIKHMWPKDRARYTRWLHRNHLV